MQALTPGRQGKSVSTMRLVKRSYLVAAAGAATLALALWWPFSRPACARVSGAGEIAVDVAGISKGQAKFFCYPDKSGKEIRFVIARGRDGSVRVALDACRQCYVYREGYMASHGRLVCRFCGNRYRIEQMNSGEASCVPLGLRYAQQANLVRISVAELRAHEAMF